MWCQKEVGLKLGDTSMFSTDGKATKSDGSVEDLKRNSFPFIEWKYWKGEKEREQELRWRD